MESPRLRFNTEVHRSEDYLIWNTLFARIKSLCLITDKPLYCYYVANRASITHGYVENYWQMAKTIYSELKSVYADNAVACEKLDIMLMRRAYLSLNIATLAESKNQLYSDIKSVLKDKDLRSVVRSFSFKQGIAVAGMRYLLLKFHLYFIIKLIFAFIHFKKRRST